MLCHVLTDFHRYVQMARKSSINVKARAEKSIEEHKSDSSGNQGQKPGSGRTACKGTYCSCHAESKENRRKKHNQEEAKDGKKLK